MPKKVTSPKKNSVPEEKKPTLAALIPRSITTEMEESYLDYAMSVIVARALPDVRDGFKPVHRKILYAMWTIGLKSTAKFRKSATIVGEVLGKYHPHGDTAVYESMVRMAQEFSLRYPLVWGQGNFGSMDGDSAAAYRYTEAKMKKIAEEMLYDIDKGTVDFVPTYDGSHKEPSVLPAKLPNMLLNGTVGIAVGMATAIPPHNLNEICDGIIHLIDHRDAEVNDLMEYVKGPDFPTGGEIFDIKEIARMYATGKGSVVMRAKTEIVEDKNGKFNILVHEVPYQTNKATLIEKMADLVKDKKLEGIKDIRDESNREGVRIVIELKKEAYPKKVLNKIFKLTTLQTKFHTNMLALVDGGLQPRVLNLKMVLEEYIEHRREVIKRRTEYELAEAEARAHILEGLKIALDHIDAVIKIIKQSKDKEVARINLIKKFKLTEIQAVAILEMRLQQLANLETQKILDELKEKKILIKNLKTILGSQSKMLTIIKDELKEIKKNYGDERRTIVNAHEVGSFSQEDLIPKETVIVAITKDGYIKRVAADTFKSQSRGGKGVIGLTTKEEDIVEHFFTTNTHADVLFFTSTGRVFEIKAHEIPSSTRTAKGQSLANFLQLGPEEIVKSVMPMDELGDFKFLFFATNQGLVKKVAIEKFQNIRKSGLIAIKLKDGDFLRWVKPTTGKDHMMLITLQGQAIRFKEAEIRAMGRSAAGVRGIRIKKNDKIVGMDVITNGQATTNEQLLVVMQNGYGKRTGLAAYKIQGRGGSGIKTAKITDKTGEIDSAFIVSAKLESEDLIIISENGQVIRLPLKSVNILGRATQGVRLMRFKEKSDKVASVTFI